MYVNRRPGFLMRLWGQEGGGGRGSSGSGGGGGGGGGDSYAFRKT